MNYLKNSLFIVILLFLITQTVIGQTNPLFPEFHEKYWFYRERLKYFVKPGRGIGESIILDTRNRSLDGNYRVGDQTYDLGWYMGILATEYYLLTQSNQPQEAKNQTLTELYYAMRAFTRLDMCEEFEPWNGVSIKDGFFMRHDIQLTTGEAQFDTSYLNHDLTIKDVATSRPPGLPSYIDTYSAGENNHEEWVKTAMSQDHAALIIMGFGFVTKCLPAGEISFVNTMTGVGDSYNFVQHAKNSIIDVGNYVGNINLQNGFSWNPPLDEDDWLSDLLRSIFGNDIPVDIRGYWTIFDPNRDIVKRGHWAFAFRYGFKEAIRKLTNHTVPTDLPGSIGDGDGAWKKWADAPIGKYYSRLFACVLAAIGDSWNSTIPMKKTDDRIDDLLTSNDHAWFYILMYIFFQKDHNLNSKYINNGDNGTNNSESTIETWLDEAPLCGPYSLWHDGDDRYFDFCDCRLPTVAPDLWGSQNRFRHQYTEQLGHHWLKGNFPGLDYMLFYNLYHYYRNWWYGWDYGYIPYRNMMNSTLSEDYPYQENNVSYGNSDNPSRLRAFRSFNYNGEVQVNEFGEGDLSIIAGDRIQLTPGFHVYQGGHFSAKVEEFDCFGSSSDTKSQEFKDNNFIKGYWNESSGINFDSRKESLTLLTQQSKNEFGLQPQIYPNPAQNHIQIQVKNHQLDNLQITIRDVFGNTILIEPNYKPGGILDISTLSNGIYIAEIVIDKRVYQERFVVL